MNIKVFKFLSSHPVPFLFQFACNFFFLIPDGIVSEVHRTWLYRAKWRQQTAALPLPGTACITLRLGLDKSATTSYTTDSKVYLHTEQQEPVWFH